MLAGSAWAADRAADQDVLVYRIDSVSASVEHNRLVVHARGAVKSGGWTAPRLRIESVGTPQDRTLVIGFMAVPPPRGSAVIQALLPVAADLATRLRRPPAGAVRVVSETNDVTTQILP